jgi:hypothetical protein
MDFQKLLEKQIIAPIIPQFTHPGDTRNFEKYPEIDLEEEMKPAGVDPLRNMFPEF